MKLKSFSTVIETVNKFEKAAYWVGEEIFKSYIWYGVNIQYVQITRTTQLRKQKQPN